MLNAFQKIVLWCIAIIAISFITVIVMYRMAIFIAIAGCLLILGFVVGVPLVLVLKSKAKRWRKC
jgi:hypothetical protein